MARKLASAVALIAMAVSATALALGLGDLQTRSALNQAFEAEVELLSVDPTELDGLRVRLASPEAFQRAGVDRPFFLAGLKFTPQLNAAGKTVVRVHSDKPIREPFLNFLMEVQWPNGKMVREYTVLLDPPTTLARRPARVERPQATGSAATSSSRASAGSSTSQAAMPNEYVVQDSETLWGISRKLRPDGASLAQTMMALYKANPDAFAQGNINRLQKGRILRVPSRDEFFALSRREAEAAYGAEQNAALASRTQPPVTSTDATADAATTTDSGVAGSDAATTDSSELRIATPRPEGQGVAGAGDDAATEAASAEDLKNALLLARENAETSRQATDNLRTEVSTLEQQLADMQRLLSLKDDQLARMQATVQADGGTPTEAVTAPDMAAPEDAATDGAAVESGAESVTGEDAAIIDGEAASPADAGVMEAGVMEESIDVAPDTATPADATDTGITATPLDDAAPEEATTSPEQAIEPDAAAEPESTVEPIDTARPQGLLDRLMGNTTLLAGAAAAIMALLVALLLFLRRRKQDDSEDSVLVDEDLDESILLDPSEGDGFDLGPEDAAPGDNDTSFLSEFSPSEMHSLADETSEVDPVSEADVYIAYGRYDQAEDLLAQALNREPERMALKFKLLEVYYANRNVAAFTACAQELANAGQDGVDTGAWQRVCDMGRDIAPDYPLFAAGAAGGATTGTASNFEPSQPAGIDPMSAFGEESILDIPSPDDDKTAGDDTVDTHSEPVGETEMDMTLDLDDLSMPHSIAQDDETLDGLESIELELPDLDMDPAKKTVDTDVSDDSLIFELDTSLEDSVVDSQPAPAVDEGLDAESLQAQLEELSDLTDLDDELSQLTADFDDQPESARQGQPEPLSGPDEVDMDLDIPSPFADQMADEDEVQTKLDLAIAYVEMGDKEGARSILDEVCAEGSESQKAEAEKLLVDISA